jgi:hypothetical protein
MLVAAVFFFLEKIAGALPYHFVATILLDTNTAALIIAVYGKVRHGLQLSKQLKIARLLLFFFDQCSLQVELFTFQVLKLPYFLTTNRKILIFVEWCKWDKSQTSIGWVSTSLHIGNRL